MVIERAPQSGIRATTRAILRRTAERRAAMVLEASKASLEDHVESLRSENARLRRELGTFRRLAYRDDLTGLRNRRLFDERAIEEWSRAARLGNHLSVVLIDLDNFKAVNDSLGHLAGDDVLRWTGQFLTENSRNFDVAARIGGDEFALLLPHTDERGLTSVLGRMRRALRNDKTRPMLPASLGFGLSFGGAATALAAAAILLGARVARSRRVEITAGGLMAFASVTAALPGPPLVIGFSDMKPSCMRGTASASILVVAILAGISLLLAGRFGTEELKLLGLLLPGALLGLLSARYLRPVLDRSWFRTAVLVMACAGGIALVIRQAMG